MGGVIMRARFTCVLLIAILVSTGVAGGADAMRAGEATFTPPEGWKTQSQPDGLVRLVAPDDNAMILVMPGGTFDGDLGDAFGKTWTALRQGLKVQKVLKGGQPESRVNGKGYETVRTEATLQDANGNRLSCRYVLVRNAGALCGVAYLGTPQAFEQFNGA